MPLRSIRVAALLVLSVAVRAAGAADAPPVAATLGELGRWVIAADFAKDGSTLVTAGGESLLYRPGDVVVWKPDGTRVGDLAGHPTTVWAVRISPDGSRAATAGYDGLVKLWNYPERTLTSDLKKHRGWVRSLDFSPDGTTLATAGEDGTVILWDTATASETKTIAAHAAPVTAVRFSPDGGTLASGGGDKIVKLWSVADGTEKVKLDGHGDAIWAITYSPDGSKLATAGADRSIKLWSTADSKELATLKGHTDWVTSLAFSADGTRMVSGSLDGAVKLWDVNAKGEQEGPPAEKSSVWCVAFAPDGARLFVGTHAGGKLVSVPAPKLLPPPPPPPSAPPPATTAAPTAAAAPAATAPAGQGWKPLVPSDFKSMAGATAAIAADGAVTVTGSLARDTYTLRVPLPAGLVPAAIRLEALADKGLPAQGPGRASNGNFVLTTFGVLFGEPGKTETPTPVAFASAKADHEQPNFTAAGAIDSNPATGWAIGGGTGKDRAITFEISPDAKIQAGAPLTITVDQQYSDGQHALGKFRVSVMPAGGPRP